MAACAWFAQPVAQAQSVIFPQQAQPGVAVSAEQDGTYTLKNDLLEASFKKSGTTLLFGGCDAMNLKSGTELFRVKLGDGTVVPASQMTLGEVTLEDLSADADAAKGSLRLPGKSIKATFTYNTLTVEWRAVLRDGSHYLRTELDLSSSEDLAMTAVYPMIYNVLTPSEEYIPQVVGNTRGAILASDKIFAGLETPMGINTVESSSSSISGFTPNSWTDASFSWAPGDDTPDAILNLGFTASQIVGTRGYVSFSTAGNNVITFTYASGNHRLNIVGVDAVDVKTGKVVASDYHVGYTGTNKENNTYTLNIPEATVYLLRYFMETKTETITSSGNITFDNTVSVPTIVYDATDENYVSTEYAETTEKTLSQTYSESWWTDPDDSVVPSDCVGLVNSNTATDVRIYETSLENVVSGNLSVTFLYSGGNNRLQIVGVDLLQNGTVMASDYHFGYTGGNKENNAYTLTVPSDGSYTLRYLVTNAGSGEGLNSTGSVTVEYTAAGEAQVTTLHLVNQTTTPILGEWSRSTTLKAGKTWNVSAVVGIIAPDQARRSVLCYSERERAVPWRAFPLYNSWYELNIDRNNAAPPSYTGNMTEAQCLDVLDHWKSNFYDVYNVAPQAFVWDDGWDEYGTWTFNPNFPNGFTEMDEEAQTMGAGIGAWLGPVGGYGTSGSYRRQYWTDQGKSMSLSNEEYYKYFVDACLNMVNNYDFRFFKFDGISTIPNATGPDMSLSTGEEDAEAIISVERDVRAVKPDIFLNTTVGTWASPFWFQFTDAVWRQDADYSTAGNNSIDRENWITYRDHLVYQNFVQNSPLCPINTLMTHGFILSSHGEVSKNMTYKNVLNELRCAFACGSGMVELYADYERMNNIEDTNGNAGALWKDLAECMKWQKDNADVLPDIHWVGGNPWDGSKCNVYGWASWNGKKATLALRNGGSSVQTYTFTLRQALDIPAYETSTIILSDAFTQRALSGLTLNTALDLDTEITVTLPASSVYIYNGKSSAEVAVDDARAEAQKVLDLTGVGYPKADAASRTTLQEAINASDATVATINAAVAAYKASVDDIQMPQDGKVYKISAHYYTGTEQALYWDSELGRIGAKTADQGKSSYFFCHEVDGKFLFVNKDGKYLNWFDSGEGADATKSYSCSGTKASGATDTYDATANLWTLDRANISGFETNDYASDNSAFFGLIQMNGNGLDKDNGLAATTFFLLARYSLTDGASCDFISANKDLKCYDSNWNSDGQNRTFAYHFEEVSIDTYNALTLQNDSEYGNIGTYSTPFPVTLPAGMTAYYATSYSDGEDMVKLTAVEGESVVLPENTGFVIVGESLGEHSGKFNPVPATTEGESIATNVLQPTNGDPVEVDAATTAYILGQIDGTLAFYRLSDSDRTIAAFKAYLLPSDASVSSIKLDFGSATGINSALSADGENAPVFDLSGRHVTKPAHGVYIKSGKKIVVK